MSAFARLRARAPQPPPAPKPRVERPDLWEAWVEYASACEARVTAAQKAHDEQPGAKLQPHVRMKSKYRGCCCVCGERVPAGEDVLYFFEARQIAHPACCL